MCVVRGDVMCGAHSVHMARVAEEVGVQREALRAGLIGELLAALLRVEERRRGEVSCGFASKRSQKR